MNTKIFGLAFLLAAVLEMNTLHAMTDVIEGGDRSRTPPPSLSLYEQGWTPSAPCRSSRDIDRAKSLATKHPKQYRFVNGTLWIK